MKKLPIFLLTIAFFAMFSLRFPITSAQAGGAARTDIHAADAAFRDGLFLGRLAASTGEFRHVCVGRWASSGDRDLFRAGYEAGYQQVSDGATIR